MTRMLHGVVHGRTVELRDDPGLKEGQKVQIELTPISDRSWGDGIRRSAGALADVAGLDEEIEAILAERKHALFREIEP